jgi:CCR4-NOT transcription complex subunit 2
MQDLMGQGGIPHHMGGLIHNGSVGVGPNPAAAHLQGILHQSGSAQQRLVGGSDQEQMMLSAMMGKGGMNLAAAVGGGQMVGQMSENVGENKDQFVNNAMSQKSPLAPFDASDFPSLGVSQGGGGGGAGVGGLDSSSGAVGQGLGGGASGAGGRSDGGVSGGVSQGIMGVNQVMGGPDPYSLQFGMLRHKHGTTQNGEFIIQNEEFPALGGGGGGTKGGNSAQAQAQAGQQGGQQGQRRGSSGGSKSGGSTGAGAGAGGEGQTNNNNNIKQSRSGSNGGGGSGRVDEPGAQFLQPYGQVMGSQQVGGVMQLGMPPPPPPKDSLQPMDGNPPPPPPPGAANNAQGGGKSAGGSSAAAGGKALEGNEKFGLLGLLSVIRMSDADLTTLALGTDLTTLGLNLNSPGSLYKSFTSPWSDAQVPPEPDFKVPPCYLQQVPSMLQPSSIKSFPLETLFYMFYSMCQEEGQVLAAEELWSRGWCYHREHKLWLARVPNTEPVVKTDRYERGSFLVFDSMAWDIVRKDNFVLHYQQLEQALSVARQQQQQQQQIKT